MARAGYGQVQLPAVNHDCREPCSLQPWPLYPRCLWIRPWVAHRLRRRRPPQLFWWPSSSPASRQRRGPLSSKVSCWQPMGLHPLHVTYCCRSLWPVGSRGVRLSRSALREQDLGWHSFLGLPPRGDRRPAEGTGGVRSAGEGGQRADSEIPGCGVPMTQQTLEVFAVSPVSR